MTPKPRKATFAIISSRSYAIDDSLRRQRRWRQPIRLDAMTAVGGPSYGEGRWRRFVRGRLMALNKEQILESLGRIPAPDGRPLPQTGTLSEIVVSDGKVFFSMTVDAASVRAWEPVRKQAEDA